MNMAAASSSSFHPRHDGGGVHHQTGHQEIQEGEIPRGARPGVGSATRERGHHYHHGRRQVHRCPLRRSWFTVLPDIADGQRGGQKSEEGTRCPCVCVRVYRCVYWTSSFYVFACKKKCVATKGSVDLYQTLFYRIRRLEGGGGGVKGKNQVTLKGRRVKK